MPNRHLKANMSRIEILISPKPAPLVISPAQVTAIPIFQFLRIIFDSSLSNSIDSTAASLIPVIDMICLDYYNGFLISHPASNLSLSIVCIQHSSHNDPFEV